MNIHEQETLYRAMDNPATCSLQQIITAIIGGPQPAKIASLILEKFPTLLALAAAHVSEFAEIDGVGQVTAIRLAAAVQLAQHAQNTKPLEKITCPADAAGYFQALIGYKDQEHLAVMLLNTRNHVIELKVVYVGSVNSSQIRLGEVFKQAIKRSATSIIIAHNHPSGDPAPSPEDVALTRMAKNAGELLDITVLDHMVLGGGRYVSLKERGLGFN